MCLEKKSCLFFHEIIRRQIGCLETRSNHLHKEMGWGDMEAEGTREKISFKIVQVNSY